MKNKLKKALNISIVILILWTVLTFWVQYAGDEKTETFGNKNFATKALIIYNPDPIYNLDEQVCKGFAEGLAENGILAKVTTTKLASEDTVVYDLYVFCANTYNWAPDWRTLSLIKRYPHLQNKKVVAITLGSGSTSRAKRIVEEAIMGRKAILIGSETYWLLRPNDEKRIKEKNNRIATDMAKHFGRSIGKIITHPN
jgi:hypothetical protein